MVDSSKEEERAGVRITYTIADTPPWYLCLFLGLQHVLTMIGGTLSLPFILCPALCIRCFLWKLSRAVNEIAQSFLSIQRRPLLGPPPCSKRLLFRADDPARGYIISTIFFVSGLVTLLQTTIGCRLPIVQVRTGMMMMVLIRLCLLQGGTFTFVTPTLALLALDRWSRPCTVLYCTVLYCTSLYCTVLYCTSRWVCHYYASLGSIDT